MTIESLDERTPQARWQIGGQAPDWLLAARRARLSGPMTVLRADHLSDVMPVLQAAWDASRAGAWVCGYVSYEAAPAFDPALPVHAGSTEAAISGAPVEPLVVFLVASHITELPADAQAETASGFLAHRPWTFDDRAASDRSRSAIQAVRAATAEGRYYQLNLTTSLHAQGQGDAGTLFDGLAALQPALLGFCIQTTDWSVVSASPELFFHWDGERIVTQPMKGTAAPSGNPQYDIDALSGSAKDRAENVMIVDLLRNDVSRVAEPGSVAVPSLFDVQVHPTVVQMTSCITARTRRGITLPDVFQALFPCGSVTGAPKREAMAHLRELEGRPRGVYCGAVGLLAPGGKAFFNVAIRTLVHHHASGHMRYGVGSGLTWYSDPAAEWREWQWKSRLAHRCTAAFQIVETVRLQSGVCMRAQAHLARMQSAADAFGYVWSSDAVQAALSSAAQTHGDGVYRGRWLLDAAGSFRIELHPFDPLPMPMTLQWAAGPLDASPGEWPFVHHKTTWRLPYERHRSSLPNAPDVLMRSRMGELLETPRGNLVLLDEGGLWTPSSHWQLPGILQQALLQSGQIQQRRLTLTDLMGARAVWVINSLRGWMPVSLLLSPRGDVWARWSGEAPPM